LEKLTIPETKKSEDVSPILRSCVQSCGNKAAIAVSELKWSLIKITIFILTVSMLTDLLSNTYIVLALVVPILYHTPYILWERRQLRCAQETWAEFAAQRKQQ